MNKWRRGGFRVALKVASITMTMVCAMINLSAAAQPLAACDLLTVEQVGLLVGDTVRTERKPAQQAQAATSQCRYIGAKMTAEIEVLRSADEIAAVALYAKTIQSVPGNAANDLPLHGVGRESRLRIRDSAHAIIARFGVNVIVVTNNAGRPAVVGLARAVVARLAAP